MSAGPAIVTGAARGLGEKVAERLVGDGRSVVLVDVSPEVQTTARRVDASATNARSVAVVGDVADEHVCADALPRNPGERRPA